MFPILQQNRPYAMYPLTGTILKLLEYARALGRTDKGPFLLNWLHKRGGGIMYAADDGNESTG